MWRRALMLILGMMPNGDSDLKENVTNNITGIIQEHIEEDKSL